MRARYIQMFALSAAAAAPVKRQTWLPTAAASAALQSAGMHETNDINGKGNAAGSSGSNMRRCKSASTHLQVCGRIDNWCHRQLEQWRHQITSGSS